MNSRRIFSQTLSSALARLQVIPLTIKNLHLVGEFPQAPLYYLETVGFLGGLTSLKDETAREQHRLFDELDEEDRQTVLKIVDKMLTPKKFNQFFHENIAK